MNEEQQNDAIIDVQPAESGHPQTPRQAFFSLHRKKMIIGIVVLLAILGLLTREVYVRPVTDGFVRIVANVVPFPAISVNGTVVTIHEYLSEYDALVNFFKSSGDSSTLPSDQELEEAISETLINKVAIQQLANTYGVKIDQDKVESYFQDVIATQESQEAFEQDLLDTFGWTTKQFKKQIVESIVLALQMSDYVLSDDEIQKEKYSTISAAKDRLNQGEDFATVAKDVHAAVDPTLDSDLGYIKLSDVPEEWRESVSVLNVGDHTDILSLKEGFAIFTTVDKVVTADNTQMHLLVITVPKITLQEVVEEYLDTAKVNNYITE